MTTDKRVARLKEACRSRNVEVFCALIGPVLRDNFKKWLDILREQRLIENFRRPALMEAIRITLYSRLSDYPERFLTFSNHVDVCLLAQRAFDTIDAETRAISPVPVNEDHYNETIIRISEVVFEGQTRRIESQIGGGLTPTRIHQLMGAENFLRKTADTCNVLLNSAAPARSRIVTKRLPDDPEFDRLIGLGMKYLEVKAAFDMYTYGHLEVAVCDARTIQFLDKVLLRATVRAVAAERSGSADNTRVHPVNFVVRELEEKLGEPKSGEDFQTFLMRQEALVPLMRRLADMVVGDLFWEIEQYFDTLTVIDKKRGITIRDLIGCWAVLRVFAAAVAQWQHGREWSVVQYEAVAHIRRSLIVDSIKKFINCTGVKARALARRFQADSNQRPIDLFFTPLLVTNQPGEVLIGSRFIAGGRFERNLFSILVADGVVDQDAKGFRPVESLISSFEVAGFLAIGDLPIIEGGELITDVDVAAFKEGILFLGQAKVVIEPDTIYEGWKAEKRLEHAADQIRSSLTHQHQIIGALKQKYSGAGIEVEQVFPFILTNTRQFTEMVIGGFPVVDLPYVEFVLGGARATEIVMNSTQMGVGSGHSFISGEFPTALEFRNLLADTIHQVKRRFKQKGTREIVLGDLKIIAPTTQLHPSPHPFMKVLTDEEMERFLSGGGPLEP
jgi:hypothetical protein